MKSVNQFDLERYLRITDRFYIRQDQNAKLGEGNYGKVFKGYDKDSKRQIAVKIIPSNILGYFNWQREINNMSLLSKGNHPNIMEYYGYELTNWQLYIFIELCSGRTLAQQIKEGISQLEAAGYIRSIMDAMVYVNSLGILHRDLKPQNILLTKNKTVKLADFGISRQFGIQMTQGICTPKYAAPQIMNMADDYNQNCDVFSAGYIVYEILTGRSLLGSIKTKTQLKEFLRVSCKYGVQFSYPKHLSPLWTELTNKMLTIDYHKRPTFRQVLEWFQSVSSQLLSHAGNNNKTQDPLEQLFNQKKSDYHVYKQMCKIYLSPLKRLAQNRKDELNKIPNVYKYMIMLVSLMSFLSFSKERQQKLNEALERQLPVALKSSSLDNANLQELAKKIKAKSKSEIKLASQNIQKYKALAEIVALRLKQYGIRLDTSTEKLVIQQFQSMGAFVAEQSPTFARSTKQCCQLFGYLSDQLYLTDLQLLDCEAQIVKDHLTIQAVSDFCEAIKNNHVENVHFLCKSVLEKLEKINALTKQELTTIILQGQHQ